MEQLDLFEAAAPSPFVLQEIAGMTRIEEMISAGEKPEVILRQIAFQMALVYQQSIESLGNRKSLKPLLEKIRCYRELQKSILEIHAYSTGDHLDFDGAKFKFVFSEILKLFQTAMVNAGIDHLVAKTVMLHFAGILRENEERIRAELRRL